MAPPSTAQSLRRGGAATATRPKAIDFGNGYVGLFYESDGLGYMAIPNGKSNRG
jgi:hypothetical protein